LGGRVFAERDRVLVEGRGVRVRDAGGRWLLDSRSSLRTVTFGHSYTPIIDAINRQLYRLPYAETIRHDRPSDVVISFSDKLIDALPEQYTRVRLSSSGSRMVEEAIVVARFARVSGEGSVGRTDIIANKGAWHGLGGIASAATDDPALQQWAGPLNSGFHHVEPNDLDALDRLIEKIGVHRLAAILIEPINGVTATMLEPEYVRGIYQRCQQNGLYLIADEISTGMGRTGYLSYCDHLGVRPDLLVLGKGISSGYVPVTALAITENVYRTAVKAWPRIIPHSSSTDGSPLAAAAGLAVLEALSDGDVLLRVRSLGEWLGARLAALAARTSAIAETLGTGFMHFVNMRTDTGWDRACMHELSQACEKRGLLIDHVWGRTVIWTPPLITTQDELEEMVDIFAAALDDTLQWSGIA
jgi:adenosylmethionine-8-amino-7-oxononanoate aminotransferase